MNNLARKNIRSPLVWVKPELDITIESIHTLLKTYTETMDNDKALTEINENLYLVRGSLEILEFYAVALLVESMQSAVDALLEKKASKKEDVFESLLQATLALKAYIDKLYNDQSELPLSLLPVMNDLRASIDEPLLSESALFLPNLSIVPKTPEDIPSDDDEHCLIDNAKSLRPYYQAALLTWFRDPSDKLSIQQMKLVAKNLESSCLTPRNRQIWWILGGLYEALSDKGLKPNISIKLLLGQADRILKSLSQEGSTLFEKAPPVELLKNALYYISQSTSNGERIKSLKQIYSLSDVIPSDQDIATYRNELNSPSSDSLLAISDELKKVLDQVKSTVENFARNSLSETDKLTQTIIPLKHIADTMSLLNLGNEKKLLKNLTSQISAIISSQTAPSNETMLDIAANMLLVENALNSIGSNKNKKNDASDGTLKPTGEFNSGEDMTSSRTGTLPEAEFRLLVIKTAEEAKKNIADVKKNMLSYLSSNDKPVDLVHDISALILEIKGSMLMLQNKYLPNILTSVLHYVKNEFATRRNHNKDENSAFAEVIISIEYYLETIIEERSPTRDILEISCQNLIKLGYPVNLPNSILESAPALEPVVTHISNTTTRVNINTEQQDTMNETTDDSNVLSFATEEPDPEVKEIFIDEAFEELSNMYVHIIALKLNPNDSETLSALRRIYHTLKGSGKIAGAIELSNVATATDDYLAKVMCKSIEIDNTGASLLSEAHQLLYLIIERFQNNIPANKEVTEFLAKLDNLSNVDNSSTNKDSNIRFDNELNSSAISQLLIIETFIKKQAKTISNSPITKETNNAIKQLAASANKTENLEFIQTTRLLSKHIDNVSKKHTPVDQETLDILDEFCATAREIFTEAPTVEASETSGIEKTSQENNQPTQADPQNSLVVKENTLSDESYTERENEESQITSVIDDEDNADLIEIFTEEALELIEKGHKIISESKGEDDAFLAALQRLLHTMKGSARMARVTSVGTLAHTLESVFEATISKNISTPKNISQLSLETLDMMSDMIENIRSGEEIRNHDDLITRLKNAATEKTDTNKDRSSVVSLGTSLNTKKTIETTTKDSIDSKDTPNKITPTNKFTEAVHIEPKKTTLDFVKKDKQNIEIRATTENINTAATAIDSSTIKSEAIKVNASVLDKMVDFAIEENTISNRIGDHVVTCKSNLFELDKAISRTLTQMRDLQFESNVNRTDAMKNSNDGDDLNLNSFSESQKVAQRLMESIGDIENLHSTLTRLMLETDNLIHQQKKIHHQLHESLLSTRMVTFSIQTQRMQRIVRQTCSELHKKAKLVLEGTDGSIDRSILETIMGPLEHIIRNAIAHGIEHSNDRRNNKKNETGTIKISFSKDKSEHLIVISDDGAGLDLDVIQNKAIEKGLLEKNKTYTVDKIVNLIFEPGFSTSNEVSQISGRGVGMDVVLNTINDLGGSISVTTDPNKGSIFTIRLPFTLSRNHSLIINSGSNTYALPSSCIEQSFPVTQTELMDLYTSNSPIFQFGSHQYPLWYIDTLLNDSPTSLPAVTSQSIVILLKFGKQRIALHVDSIEDTRDTVLKPNSPQLSNVSGIAGATVMGDGKVVLIIDIPSLMTLSEKADEKPRQFQELAEDLNNEKEIVTLVVDDSITVRKVTERFLKRNGITSLSAKDGLEALELLEREMPDIMLVDIEMPNMDGLELATRIKADKRLQHIPIVMITSRTGTQHRSAATKIGVDVFLGKPYQEAELIGYIQALTGKRVKH